MPARVLNSTSVNVATGGPSQGTNVPSVPPVFPPPPPTQWTCVSLYTVVYGRDTERYAVVLMPGDMILTHVVQ